MYSFVIFYIIVFDFFFLVRFEGLYLIGIFIILYFFVFDILGILVLLLFFILDSDEYIYFCIIKFYIFFVGFYFRVVMNDLFDQFIDVKEIYFVDVWQWFVEVLLQVIECLGEIFIGDFV